MIEYYLVNTIYKNKSLFFIYFVNEEDGFIKNKQEVAWFPNISMAQMFCKNNNIILQEEITFFDFSKTFELLNNIENPESCRELIGFWNFFSDLFKASNKEFIGDSQEWLIIEIYDKLFCGINMTVLKNDRYYAVFNDEEKEKCILILQEGLNLLENI